VLNENTFKSIIVVFGKMHRLDKIWSRMPFNTQSKLKGRGRVLMTEFDKSEKTGWSSFDSFRVQIE
jgi:hypothetical protein